MWITTILRISTVDRHTKYLRQCFSECALICFSIHPTKRGTLAYIPGKCGWAHCIPQLTMPPTNHLSLSLSIKQRRGPPESPCNNNSLIRHSPSCPSTVIFHCQLFSYYTCYIGYLTSIFAAMLVSGTYHPWRHNQVTVP